MILSPRTVHFTGIEHPTVVVALAPEGVSRRRSLFAQLTAESLVLHVDVVVVSVLDFIDRKDLGVRSLAREADG